MYASLSAQSENNIKTQWIHHNVNYVKSLTPCVMHLQDSLRQSHNRLGPSESRGSVWTPTWIQREKHKRLVPFADVCCIWLRDLQLCHADVQQVFTRWGPVEWWQPASSRLFLDGAACSHSLGVSLKELQPLFETLGGNTCMGQNIQTKPCWLT